MARVWNDSANALGLHLLAEDREAGASYAGVGGFASRSRSRSAERTFSVAPTPSSSANGPRDVTREGRNDSCESSLPRSVY
jgi:hypothetical protein